MRCFLDLEFIDIISTGLCFSRSPNNQRLNSFMTKHVKWYVNLRKWKPARDEWLKLTASVDEDELTRINRYVFKEDSSSSLVGQALIRKFLSQALQKPSNEIKLTRTAHGRPVVCRHYQKCLGTSWPGVLDFNVSHSGDYCVLVGLFAEEGCQNLSVGVDVTKIVRKETQQDLDRFLDLMSRRQFLTREWDTVIKATSNRQKCINFTRLWCLKESFIKSNGLGLSFGLGRICFEPSERWRYNITTDILRNNIISDTTVSIDSQQAFDWCFQETALDDEHLIAIGYNLKNSPELSLTDFRWSDDLDKSPFAEVTIDSLVASINPITDPIEENWLKFAEKRFKSH